MANALRLNSNRVGSTEAWTADAKVEWERRRRMGIVWEAAMLCGFIAFSPTCLRSVLGEQTAAT